tara:strand:+ start:87 stop:308 length:222 start_codon:yes stop_codon:yes gene_type:complete
LPAFDYSISIEAPSNFTIQMLQVGLDLELCPNQRNMNSMKTFILDYPINTSMTTNKTEKTVTPALLGTHQNSN